MGEFSDGQTSWRPTVNNNNNWMKCPMAKRPVVEISYASISDGQMS